MTPIKNMIATIQKTNKLSGTVLAPGSKSHTIRGLILGLLARGQSILKNPLDSEDTKTAIKVCESLGAKIKVKTDKITISGLGSPINGHATRMYTGNSGITTRFILPVLGLRKNFSETILDCGEQMRARPIKSLVDALNNLGMNIKYQKNRGCCPLVVSGKLIGGKVEIDGITSQYLSALLMSLPLAEQDSEIIVKNLHERPYVEMTLKWLDDLGVQNFHTRAGKIDKYKIKGKQTYKYFNKQIPGDFSSASYFLAAGALIGHKIIIKGLNMGDPQGDRRLVEILKQMGAKISASKLGLAIGKSNLRGKKISGKDIPDLLPTLAVIATQAKGKTEIINVKQARIKETDRIHSMSQGLRKMGAKIEEKNDGMIVYQGNLKGAKVKGYNDHRTVMALTLAGMLASGKTIISNAQSVNKTFPEFYQIMKRLGARIALN